MFKGRKLLIAVFFITALGSVFNFEDLNYIEAIKAFITLESIRDIFLVNDTSCRFIKSVLEQEPGFGTHCENVISNVLINKYSDIIERKSLATQKSRLAEHHVLRQIEEIMQSKTFSELVNNNKVNVKGLVVTKALDKSVELNINSNNF